jgi:hypothetical protein
MMPRFEKAYGEEKGDMFLENGHQHPLPQFLPTFIGRLDWFILPAVRGTHALHSMRRWRHDLLLHRMFVQKEN